MPVAAPSRSSSLARAFSGKWALVTGASAGIGEALALDLAASGAKLILTARRTDRLEALAARLRSEFKVEARILTADLASPAAPQQLYDATEGSGIAVDILVNNAGYGYLGEFRNGGLDWQRSMVDLNCSAVVHLTHLFLPRMIERSRGYIMIVASMAAFQPVPYMATYAATKAFDHMLGVALSAEVKRFGVKVSSLCPGPTESEFGQVAGSTNQFRKAQSAEAVSRIGLEALAAGQAFSMPNRSGAIQVFLQRFLPRNLVTVAAEKMFRPATLK
jgi:uncharacterized protein